MVLLVDVSEKYEIAEKVINLYLLFHHSTIKKEGQKLKAKSLSYFMVEVKLLSTYLLASI